MWNARPAAVRIIEVVSPVGFEHFFRELADLTVGLPQFPDALALVGRCGLQLGQPDWLPELISR